MFVGLYPWYSIPITTVYKVLIYGHQIIETSILSGRPEKVAIKMCETSEKVSHENVRKRRR